MILGETKRVFLCLSLWHVEEGITNMVGRFHKSLLPRATFPCPSKSKQLGMEKNVYYR